MSKQEVSGAKMMQANIDALDRGEDMPYSEEDIDSLDDKELSQEDDLTLVDKDIEEDKVDLEDDEIIAKDGYKPMTKEEWVKAGKDPDDFMTAQEFAKVGKLRDGDETRQQLSKRLVQMESTMNETLKTTQKMIKDAQAKERQKILDELKEKKDDAVKFNETEEAIELDRQINKLEGEIEVEAKAEKPEDSLEADLKKLPEDQATWFENNRHWYSADQNAGNLLNIELAKCEKKKLPFSEAIVIAEAKVKKYFPQYFDDDEIADEKADDSQEIKNGKPVPTRGRNNPISEKTDASKRSNKQKRTFADLDPAFAAIARKAAKTAKMTEAEYMETLDNE